MPVFISLGENCLVDARLKKAGLKTESFPFGSARINIEILKQIIDTDFKDFLNLEHIQKVMSYQNVVYKNSVYTSNNDIYHESSCIGLEFGHINIYEEEGRASMERKVERFKKVMCSDEKVVFVYHYRYSGNQDIEKLIGRFREFFKSLKGNYKAEFKGIILCQVPRNMKKEFRIRKFGEDLLVGEFITEESWEGDNNWDGRSDDDLFLKFFKSSTVLRFINNFSRISFFSFQNISLFLKSIHLKPLKRNLAIPN